MPGKIKESLSASIQKSLVQPDEEWLEHIKTLKAPYSHKLYSDASYHYALWMNAHHSIILIDEEGTILAANPAFYNLVEQSPSEVQKHNFFELISRHRLRYGEIVHIKEIIDGNAFCYTANTKIGHESKLIPVDLVAVRIPITLNHPFRHIIVQLYELKDYVAMKNPAYDKALNAGTWKELVVSKWFVQLCFWFIILLVILITLTGHLMPVLDKILLHAAGK